ncbi:MAG: DUF3089 domain-containing protein [Caulobacter sp.]|nr:DUF3089 domain-containing protein [Caulobacter sp.]
MKIQITTLMGAMLLAASGAAMAQTPPAAPTANDYSKPETWLCLPGRAGDACSADQTATIVAADGTLTVQPFAKAADPGIDCFYVYPTVSNDKTPNSDMVANREEESVIAVQFARFASVCRPFAPLYRQVTLTALRQYMTGQNPGADRELAYGDVKAAWDWYLKNENHGRGVVLIGHSQGSGVIQELVKREIDGKPVQKLIVGVMPIGSNVPVDEKGMFGTIPSCSKLGQTGCLVSYVSFRDTAPPPQTSRFGKVSEAGMHAACVNPAALGGGKGTPTPYLWSGGAAQSAAAPKPWVEGKTVETPFVTTPGLLTTQCVRDGDYSYLAVKTNADPSDPRTDEIIGDVMIMGKPDPNWGLHLIDMNHSMGDLVAVVKAQGEAWGKK